MARPPSGRGPSPRDDASRRGRGWDEDEPPRKGRQAAEPAPWLDEGEYDDEAPVHTLVGRRALFALLFLLGVLTIGVVVGILLVSRRESSPIDVPGVGEQIPVLASPGPWKVPPTGADIDGTPVEGQGQVLFGTGDGRETEARIALDALPEDPLPRPAGEIVAGKIVDEGEPVIEGMPIRTEEPATAPVPPPPPPPVRPKASDTVVPREAPVKPVTPKVILAPEPAARPPAGGGQVLQLGAFSSESRARTAFKDLSGRYAYLAGLEPQIVPVASDTKTLYRLRTTAPSPRDAKDICGRLKVAGEACSVVN